MVKYGMEHLFCSEIRIDIVPRAHVFNLRFQTPLVAANWARLYGQFLINNLGQNTSNIDFTMLVLMRIAGSGYEHAYPYCECSKEHTLFYNVISGGVRQGICGQMNYNEISFWRAMITLWIECQVHWMSNIKIIVPNESFITLYRFPCNVWGKSVMHQYALEMLIRRLWSIGYQYLSKRMSNSTILRRHDLHKKGSTKVSNTVDKLRSVYTEL